MPRIGALTEAPRTCGREESLGVLRDRLAGVVWDLCAVVGEQDVVLGVLEPGDLEGDADQPAGQVMNPAPSTFRPDVPVEELRDWFARHDGMRAAPVTTPEGRLLGVITRARLDTAVPASSGAG